MPSIKASKELGAHMGKASASWAIDPQRWTIRDFKEFLRMYDEGDPILYDQFAREWLGGQWAGESPNELLGEGWQDRHAEAFEQAAEAAYWKELLRIVKFHAE